MKETDGLRVPFGILALCALASLIGAAGALPTSAMAGEPPEEPITEACSGPFIPGHLCGTLNPGSSAKVGYYFEVEEGSSCTGGTHYTDGSEPEGESIPMSTTVSGLTPSTEYTYCLVATNSFGETAGQGLTFLTPFPPPPSIESESVSSLTPTDATLEAEIDPGNLEVGAYYQFQLVSETSEYASEILCPTNLPPTTDGCNGTQSASALPIGFIPGGSEPSSVSLDLSSAGVMLAPGTTYHYRVLAARRIATEDTIEWEAPAVSGEDKEFTTPPAIISESATNVTQHNATLGAQINPGDAPAGAYYQFQLAKNPADFASEFTCPTEGFPAGSSLCLGITPQQGALPIRSIPAGTADQPVSLDLEGVGATLEPGTTYYYRVIAARIVPTEDTTQWEEPTVFGADQTFTTSTSTPIQSCPFSGCPGNPGNGPPAARCKKGHVKRHGKCVKKHRHHKHRKHKKKHRHQR